MVETDLDAACPGFAGRYLFAIPYVATLPLDRKDPLQEIAVGEYLQDAPLLQLEETIMTHAAPQTWIIRLAILGATVFGLLAVGSAQAATATAQARCKTLSAHMLSALTNNKTQLAGRDFDATMKRALPANKLATLWKEMQAKFGTYQKSTRPSVKVINQVTVVTTPLTFSKSKLDAQIACDQSGHIAGFFLRPPSKS